MMHGQRNIKVVRDEKVKRMMELTSPRFSHPSHCIGLQLTLH
jgi:hypothetical protein